MEVREGEEGGPKGKDVDGSSSPAADGGYEQEWSGEEEEEEGSGGGGGGGFGIGLGGGGGGGWGWSTFGSAAKTAWGGLGERLTAVADQFDHLVDGAVDVIESVDAREATTRVTEASQAGAKQLGKVARDALQFLTLEGYVESEDEDGGDDEAAASRVDPSSTSTRGLERVVADKLRAERESATYSRDNSTTAQLIEAEFEQQFIEQGGAQALDDLQRRSNNALMKLSSQKSKGRAAELKSQVDASLEMEGFEISAADLSASGVAVSDLVRKGQEALEDIQKMELMWKQSLEDASPSDIGPTRSQARSQFQAQCAQTLASLTTATVVSIAALASEEATEWQRRANDARTLVNVGSTQVASVSQSCRSALQTIVETTNHGGSSTDRKEDAAAPPTESPEEGLLESLHTANISASAKFYQAIALLAPIFRLENNNTS